MQLQRVSFEEIPIKYEFFLETTGKNSFWYTLIVKFIGTYRDGSAGNPDAYFMEGIIRTGIGVWHPGAVIVDLTDFQYEWGDMLEIVFSAGNKPLATVVGPKCEAAIATLLWGINSDQPATDEEGFFRTLEEAFEYVRKKV